MSIKFQAIIPGFLLEYKFTNGLLGVCFFKRMLHNVNGNILRYLCL